MATPSTTQKTLLTEKEMAADIAVSWRGLAEFRKRRLVPFIKLGRLVRYNRADVFKALEKLTVRSI